MPPNSKETKLGSSDEEASSSAGKNTMVVMLVHVMLVHVNTWKCTPIVISGGVGVSQVPGCHLLQEMSFQ